VQSEVSSTTTASHKSSRHKHKESKDVTREKTPEPAPPKHELSPEQVPQSPASTDTASSTKKVHREKKHKKAKEESKPFEVLTTGIICLKYGRWGNPHRKHIFVSEDLQIILWKDPETEKAESILVQDIKEISVGATTPVFSRYKRDVERKLDRCFSVITEKRSLDLEVEDSKIRNQWIELLEQITKK